jgi:cytidine deaminase
MPEIGENEKMLLKAAAKEIKKAHVLWGFKVGAAVLADDGKIYEGCNVESWISGLGTCAERNAINHAVLHGNRKIKEIAIVMDESNHNEPRPCGACLQYINDFAGNPKVKIVMAKAKSGKVLFGTVKVKTVEDLLPLPYRE